MFSFDKDKMRKQLELAQCGMSGVKVAACLIASNRKGKTKAFYGSNIEIARSLVYHAEEVALLNAINSGYPWPECMYLTSTAPSHRVPMCLICRGKFSYINQHCQVVVLDEELEPVLKTTIYESVRYPYAGQGFLS